MKGRGFSIKLGFVTFLLHLEKKNRWVPNLLAPAHGLSAQRSISAKLPSLKFPLITKQKRKECQVKLFIISNMQALNQLLQSP